MIESLCRIPLVTFVFIVWLAMIVFPIRNALATGTTPSGQSSASSTSSATASGGSATVNTSGGGSVSQDNKSYGVGGTGLTSTAPCLSSVSVLFGLIATTYVEKGCTLRQYAAQCKSDACRQQMACLDPDLIPEAKATLGCKP